MKQTVRFASLENWSNAPTPATPDGVAGVFASSVLARRFPHLYTSSQRCLAAYRSGDAKVAKKIAELVPRTEFCTGLEYLAWAQFKALFLKAPNKGHERDCEIAAKKKFFAAEAACKRANRRLRYYWSRPDRENAEYRVVLSRARELISHVLGNFTEHTLEHLLNLSRPGGGSAVGTTDPLKVALPWKLGRTTQLAHTEAAKPYVRLLVEGSPRWLSLHAELSMDTPGYRVPYVVTNTNRVAFVPKDATTHRTIAVEPHLNLCLQLGVDSYLKTRLRAFGVDLSSQSRNQRLARLGAVNWLSADPLVTLDLAAASDSLCQGLVERLLPPTWLGYLRDIRSPSYRLQGGDPVEYQKWSSMGNGYTFSLETLVFWALGKACLTRTQSRDCISVYGDDIIVPRSAAAFLIEVLRYVGFSVNTDKSALFGEFRESCGEDYWADLRVVPVYLRERPNLLPTDIYRLANSLRSEWLTDDIRGYLLTSHRGRPILYGLPVRDETSCWFVRDPHDPRLRGFVRYRPSLWAWEQRVARFRPYGRDPSTLVGYAAALLGNRLHDDPEFLRAKSALRRQGKWFLARVTAG